MDYMQVDDLTVLLCNMLDNASEAMSEIGSASVELRMNSQGNDGGTIIAMTNDCRRTDMIHESPVSRIKNSMDLE